MFAHIECAFSSHTVGQYTVDNFWAAQLPDSMDQVPDGTTRFGAVEAGADKTSGKPLSSLSGRTMDYIGDSATRFAAAEAGADKTAGKSLTVLTDRTLGNIADDATYLRSTQYAESETVDNASFEASPTLPPPGWGSFDATLDYTTSAQAYAGSQSLKITATGASAQAFTTRRYKCTAGDVYQISAAVSGSSLVACRMEALFLNSSTGANSEKIAATIPQGNTSFAIYSG